MVLAEDLRQAVLQAALQGKLTEQLDTDSDVDELLKNIQEEKETFITDKRIKREKLLPEILEEDIPFDIPKNWQWVRWGNLAYSIQYGYNAPAQEEGKIKMVRISDIQDNSVNWDSVPYCNIDDDEIETYLLKENDILFARTGGTVGKSFLVNDISEDAIYAGYLIRTRYNDQLVPRYLKMFMESQLYWVQLQNGKTQGCQPNCNGETLSKMLIPLPPIEEQQRIVDRINEILAKIGEYEKIEKELEALKKEFPINMKDALLQAAMQGKLTERLESDSSVDELLAVTKLAKEEMIAQKKIKREKPLPDIEEEEIPFDMPNNWRWVRLGNIGTLTRGNGIKRNEVTATGFPCIRYGELYTTYKTKFDVAVSHTSKELFDKSQKVNKNDILMALTGENNFDIALALAYVGDETIAMGGDLTRWSNHHMNPLYLVYAMNSSYAIHKKSEMAKGDIIVHISNDKLATVLLPIPPIEEQNRIVEKLDALLPLCEALKEV